MKTKKTVMNIVRDIEDQITEEEQFFAEYSAHLMEAKEEETKDVLISNLTYTLQTLARLRVAHKTLAA